MNSKLSLNTYCQKSVSSSCWNQPTKSGCMRKLFQVELPKFVSKMILSSGVARELNQVALVFAWGDFTPQGSGREDFDKIVKESR